MDCELNLLLTTSVVFLPRAIYHSLPRAIFLVFHCVWDSRICVTKDCKGMSLWMSDNSHEGHRDACSNSVMNMSSSWNNDANTPCCLHMHLITFLQQGIKKEEKKKTIVSYSWQNPVMNCEISFQNWTEWGIIGFMLLSRFQWVYIYELSLPICKLINIQQSLSHNI